MDHAIDRSTARVVTAEVEEAVKAVLARHGLTPGRTHTTYGDLYKFSIEATPAGADTREVADWKAQAIFYDLPVDALGKTITLGTRRFTIVGLNGRARSKPVLIKDPSGRSFKTTVLSVQQALRSAEKVAV